MAEFYGKPTIEMKIVMTMTEAEARALSELASYSVEDVIAAIQEKVSSGVISAHGDALKLFLQSVRKNMSGELKRIDEARKVYGGNFIAAPNLEIIGRK